MQPSPSSQTGMADTHIVWQPWQAETLAQARQLEQPIFLSIGYPSCRRCQLMDADSFADPQVIAVLNQRYVCIRVDRYQRPDIDRLQQQTFRLLYGHNAGWPLNMLLNPHDGLAFFGATYVAPQAQHGWPGLAALLSRLADFFAEQRTQGETQNAQLGEALRAGPSPRQGRTGYALHAGPLAAVIQRLGEHYDANNGGFATAPKFPQVAVLERLLRHGLHSRNQSRPDQHALQMLSVTLERLAYSPLRDSHGGFSRYAHHSDWQQPDSEQTLSDNAQLLAMYAQAGVALQCAPLRHVAERLGVWLVERLRLPDGCFATARDRESGQVDTCVLTAANALAIRGLLIAGRLLGRESLIQAADRALESLHRHCWYQGHWRTGYQAGSLYPPAFLDDYAWLLEALLERLQTRWRNQDYQHALRISAILLEEFQEPGKTGGFYFTSPKHEALPARWRPLQDEALPAANGVVAYNLLRLAHLSGGLALPLAAERTLKYAWPNIECNPAACNGLLLALEEYYFPSQVVVIRAVTDELQTWQQAVRSNYAPQRLVLAIPSDTQVLPETLAECAPVDTGVAYLYQHGKCQTRCTSLAELQQALDQA